MIGAVVAGVLFVLPASAQSPIALKRAAEYSALHSGEAVLVYSHDSLIFEQYQNGWAAERAHPLASGTKTFACVLAALAVSDKLLTLDEPVSKALSEFSDPRLKNLTIRHLLDMTSGLDVDPAGGGLRQVTRPGGKFAYGGTGFVVFAEMMTRKLKGEDLLAYLTRRIFEPIGVKPGAWERDGAGRIGLASGAALTARDWGRVGLFLGARGRAPNSAPNGAPNSPGPAAEQLVPAAALAECGRGSGANPYYGMGLWLNPAQPTRKAPPGVQRADSTDRIISDPDLPHDLLLAAGSGGQRLYILPSQGLVVVRFGHNTGPDFRDVEFLRLLLGVKSH